MHQKRYAGTPVPNTHPLDIYHIFHEFKMYLYKHTHTHTESLFWTFFKCDKLEGEIKKKGKERFKRSDHISSKNVYSIF